MTQSRPFFPKAIHFFEFSRRAGEASPLPTSWAPVSVPEYASISVNMPKYFWKCLNNLFWLCQSSKYVWSSYVLYRLLKMPGALKKPGFWTFSLNLHPLLEGCLLFLGLDMFFMLTRHWYKAKNVDFLILKSNFSFLFSPASSLLVISSAINVLYGDLLLILNKGYSF